MTKRTARSTPVRSGERLQKFLAHCGVASRRGAEDYITQGRVDVNGQTVTELGRRIDPDLDVVHIDGERLLPHAGRIVLVLNKPVGFLCARSDPEGRPNVYRLLPDEPSLRTVGRLDFNTEGVLLVTNDGDLAERLGHARYAILRTYEARVRGVPTPEVIAALTRGVRLEDGPARAENAELIKTTEANAWVRLTLTEGRNREVRRLLERVGHPVVRLRRIAFAGVTVAGLKPGECRALSESEIHQLETRGHVGGFAMPPDPRRRSVERQDARTAASGVKRAESPDKSARKRSSARRSALPEKATNGAAPKRAAGARPGESHGRPSTHRPPSGTRGGTGRPSPRKSK